MEELNLKISSSPHVRSKDTTSDLMFDVIIALVPATVFGIYKFGAHAGLLVAVCMLSAMLSELIYEKLVRKTVTVKDCSAILTGLLLALNLPPKLPVWMAVIGSVFAIIVVKQLFGGLGQNFMNPALGARCFLLLSFSKQMTQFVYDGVTTATPLAVMKAGAQPDMEIVSYMFKGNIGGTIGETSVIALLIGAVYLLIKRVISPKIPLTYIGTFAVCIAIYAAVKDYSVLEYTLAHLCGGGLMLGAWFMATDYVTSPITPWGKIVFGVMLGLLTFVLRIFGSGAEGVSYAIIISNLFVPLIERVTVPKAFGAGADVKPDAGVTVNVQKDKQDGNNESNNKTVEPHASDKTNKNDENGSVKSKFDVKGIVKAVIVIFVITLVMGAALGAVYDITKKPILDAALKAKEEAYKEIYPDAASIVSIVEQSESITNEFLNDTLHTVGYKDSTIDEFNLVADKDGKLIGTIVIVTNKNGYGGDIQIAVGISLAENKITGISFLTLNETVGLGMKANEAEFKEQFKDAPFGEISYTKTGSDSANVIDAISGATITTSAVTDGVNSAVTITGLILGGGSVNE
ncbi:MAG: RnfABCDGE type electron transport complex subunit D [Lachnospiraceae bacterium]|nr:RnfABCDGE type electron transport complex subunit D [Lachnospiraceae bacterium]